MGGRAEALFAWLSVRLLLLVIHLAGLSRRMKAAHPLSQPALPDPAPTHPAPKPAQAS